MAGPTPPPSLRSPSRRTDPSLFHQGAAPPAASSFTNAVKHYYSTPWIFYIIFGLPLARGTFGFAPREREQRSERGILWGCSRAAPGCTPTRCSSPIAFSFRDVSQPRCQQGAIGPAPQSVVKNRILWPTP